MTTDRFTQAQKDELWERWRRSEQIANAFIIGFTKGKTIKIEQDYDEDRYGRLVVDLSADDVDVLSAGIAAKKLRAWPHKNGKAQAPKPDWCAKE